MYRLDVDRQEALIEFALDGLIRKDEMERFVEELRDATQQLMGRDIKIKADLRTFRPSAPEVAEMIRAVQEFGLRAGVKRVAEMVESQVVALQLNRVARESGTDKILRRFADDSAALRWLVYGEEEALSA
ncbi:STAS/SEC14 domain-containing protein [Archangium lipolyticum]|uniref:STAS/SEC14 domain-containing protein n=1 Tax=Archangium lipolyticum TaxID=2970465 RepID=UPI00214A43B7|nr:STAS/SEC14 domain-containing protein [Archangium lipolyticum]